MTSSPSPVKVCKVFKKYDLGLDFGLDLGSLEGGAYRREGASGGQRCQVSGLDCIVMDWETLMGGNVCVTMANG